MEHSLIDVIKGLVFCLKGLCDEECPYFTEDRNFCQDAKCAEALGYLKEYRDKMIAFDIVHGVTCPNCENDKYILSIKEYSKLYDYRCLNCGKYFNEGDKKKEDWNIEILRYPTDEDWKRCLLLARCTQGKFDTPKEPSEEWKRKILRSEHSPIRTLMFTIKMENIPYCNSVHFVRHKYGVEHYVQSQRKNPERGAERQDAPVTHIMDINAQELIFMAKKRLCYKADSLTRAIMNEICWNIREIDPVWESVLLPACECSQANCREFKPCGMYEVNNDRK